MPRAKVNVRAQCVTPCYSSAAPVIRLIYNAIQWGGTRYGGPVYFFIVLAFNIISFAGENIST